MDDATPVTCSQQAACHPSTTPAAAAAAAPAIYQGPDRPLPPPPALEDFTPAAGDTCNSLPAGPPASMHPEPSSTGYCHDMYDKLCSLNRAVVRILPASWEENVDNVLTRVWDVVDVVLWVGNKASLCWQEVQGVGSAVGSSACAAWTMDRVHLAMDKVSRAADSVRAASTGWHDAAAQKLGNAFTVPAWDVVRVAAARAAARLESVHLSTKGVHWLSLRDVCMVATGVVATTPPMGACTTALLLRVPVGRMPWWPPSGPWVASDRGLAS